jgi:NADH-quinone oxidoreductase subunit L
MSPAYQILIIPLLSAAVIALFLRRQGGIAAVVSVVAATVVCIRGLGLAIGGERTSDATKWLELGDFTLTIGYKFDDLAALMLAVVCIVGLCVHVFSLAYMGHDGAKARYFGGLSIFMFSMLGIVFADNLFMMFIFWELVGFSSWLLINNYLERQSAADASKKAFITNRVGDFGFLLGIIWCYYANGTVNLSQLADHHVFSTAIPLLLFCGAIGKSAQLPLQVWLPDAMEGPTPVSALIHAATMVAAGIYMLCRINVLMVPQALQVIMWVGTATALYAALCAIVQSDIKRVLAYSTLSQLGYMVAAYGLGALAGGEGEHAVMAGAVTAGVAAAMFHLTTHAFFKALLFLGSGSVIHACHHEQDIFQMGGLRAKMPVTFLTFTVGVLAISGLPFLAGFFSKDAILYLSYENNKAVFAILAFTAALTAFYMFRMWKIVFFGATRGEDAGHARENGATILLPLIVLAVLAAIGGYRGWFLGGVFHDAFRHVLDRVPEAEGGAHWVILGTSLVVLVVGAGLALTFYPSAGTDALAQKAPGLFTALTALKESFDRAYNYYIAKIQQRFALFLNFLEQIFLAGLIIRGIAGIVGLFGLGARALHVGNVNAYVYWFLLGIVILWAFAAGVLAF